MGFQLTDTQSVVLTIVAEDVDGNPITDDSTLAWTSSDPNVLTVDAVEGTLTAQVTTVGPTGRSTITVTDGTTSTSFEFEVVPSDVARFGLTLGALQTRKTTDQKTVRDQRTTTDFSGTPTDVFPETPTKASGTKE